MESLRTFFASRTYFWSPWPWPRRSSSWPWPRSLQVLENALFSDSTIFDLLKMCQVMTFVFLRLKFHWKYAIFSAKTFFFEITCALCPWAFALTSSIPVLGLERVYPQKVGPWPWIFFILGLEPFSSTPPLRQITKLWQNFLDKSKCYCKHSSKSSEQPISMAVQYGTPQFCSKYGTVADQKERAPFAVNQLDSAAYEQYYPLCCYTILLALILVVAILLLWFMTSLVGAVAWLRQYACMLRVFY